MVQKKLYTQLFHYLIPGIASMVSLSLYILADTYFVAAGVGGMGIAGLNIALPAYSVVNGFGLLIGVGSGVVVSVSRGRGDLHKATATFTCALWCAALLGILFTVAGALWAEPIALLLGASPQSLPYATEYIGTILSFSVFFLMNNTLVALVRNDANPRLAMVSMITCSSSNIVLDYLFIIRFGWGMFGAAFATGLAPIIGISILLLHWRKSNSYTLLPERRLPQFRLAGDILRSGGSSFITELGNGLVIFLFNFTLMRISGDMAVAAYGIVANISLVLSYVFIGAGQAIQPVLGLYHGAGDSPSCKAALKLTTVLVTALGALFWLGGQLLPHQLTALFNSENNPQLASLTVDAIRIYFNCFLFMGINICCTCYFQSTMRSRPAALLSLLRSFLLVAAGVAALPPLFGLPGVWAVMPVAEGVTLMVCIGLLFNENRRIFFPGTRRA